MEGVPTDSTPRANNGLFRGEKEVSLNEMGGGVGPPPPADPQQFQWFTAPNQPAFFA